MAGIEITGGEVRDGQVVLESYEPLASANYHQFREQIARAGVSKLTHFDVASARVLMMTPIDGNGMEKIIKNQRYKNAHNNPELINALIQDYNREGKISEED